MKIDVFLYANYKIYLRSQLDNNTNQIKGIRLKLSKDIGCQPSYLSQVLHANAHLTLEQADGVNLFFGHSRIESKYFMLLVEEERAGTSSLKKYFNEQRKDVLQDRHNLKARLTDTEQVGADDQHIYYSTWFYSAVHMFLAIPEFDNVQRIAAHLNLPVNLIAEVVEFLERTGLVKRVNGNWEFTKTRIYLGRESAFIQRHHINWRSQALQAVEKNLPGDLHYSNIISVSKEDFEKIKEQFIKTIEGLRPLIRDSKEEGVFAITLDAFKL